MSESREAIVDAATERVVDAARKPLGRRPVDVSRGATLYADAVAAIGAVALVGECRAAQTSVDRRTAWFDLADPSGQWTSMLVLAPERKRIEGFLRMDLLEFLTEGKVIAVSGHFVPGRRSGERQLRVEKISATAVEDAGAAFLARAEAQSFLESAFAQDPERYGVRDATRPYRGSAKHLAQRLSDRGVHVKRVVTLRPASSQTQDEFSRGFARVGLHEEQRSVLFDPTGLSTALDAIEPADDVVVAIHRGGGHWSDRSALDDVQVVRSIIDCAAPVFTGVGHWADETVADRAAFASAATPTMLGSLITSLAREQAQERSRRSARSATPPSTTAPVAMPRPETLRAAQRSADWQFRRRIDEARAAALYRVRMRGAILALLWAALTFVLAGSALSVLENGLAASAVWVWLALASLILTLWSASAQRRATRVTVRQRKRGWPPIDDESWFVTAAQVRTPRQFRRHFAE
ncbi:exodeoxyribonuclease VII large subunit [Plantibacter sp. ME-Dv--P-122b]|uniref:exodeoxyribonuclease VII large subunit n=1 Tax=Plantibacter sp. ME-Dv--P-122b TaxID=3040300 RepID=UPI00254B7725|nr:exodeoxyribonuclease VII large subunit [Plantibacter sp. ME-Dv--P-122b]